MSVSFAFAAVDCLTAQDEDPGIASDIDVWSVDSGLSEDADLPGVSSVEVSTVSPLDPVLTLPGDCLESSMALPSVSALELCPDAWDLDLIAASFLRQVGTALRRR